MGSWKRSTVGTPGNRATSSLVEEEKPVKGNIEVVLLGEEGRPEEQGRGAGGGVSQEPRQESIQESGCGQPIRCCHLVMIERRG